MNFEEKDLEFIKICKRNGLTPLKFAEIKSTDSDFTVTRHFYVPKSQMTSFITYVCKGGIFEILKVSLEDNMNFKPEMLINFGEVLKNLEKEIKKI